MIWRSPATLDLKPVTMDPDQSKPMPINSVTTAPSSDVHPEALKIPPFVLQLYTIVNTESVDVISWTMNGMAFEIRSLDELKEQVLGRYFRHNKYSSFQRQLNYFGFRKWTKTKAVVCTFSHPMFLRGRFDLLRYVQRGGARTMPKLTAQLNHMRSIEAQTRPKIRLPTPLAASTIPRISPSASQLPPYNVAMSSSFSSVGLGPPIVQHTTPLAPSPTTPISQSMWTSLMDALANQDPDDDETMV